MADNVSTSSNLGNNTTASVGVSSNVTEVAKVLGIDMSKMFKGPGVGKKTPPPPGALSLQCKVGTGFKINLPNLPSIYIPNIPPKLPSLPIPLSIPFGPCAIKLDPACLGIPPDLIKIVIKYLITPLMAGILPPKTEALAKVVGGKIAGVIEDIEDYEKRYKELQRILNNLSVSAMFGLDAIPCPQKTRDNATKAQEEADAAEQRFKEGKATREDTWNAYSSALIEKNGLYKKYGINTSIIYSSVRPGKAIELIVNDEKALAALTEAQLAEIEKPISDWKIKYKQ